LLRDSQTKSEGTAARLMQRKASNVRVRGWLDYISLEYKRDVCMQTKMHAPPTEGNFSD
jgi:hypothetical protein